MNKLIDIKEASLEELNLYIDCSETNLKHCNEPEKGYFIAESVKVIVRAMEAGFKPVSMLMEYKHLEGEAKELAESVSDINIYLGDKKEIRDKIGYELTRGALCIFNRAEYISIEETVKNARRIAVMDNVENPTNMGAIVRSAAAIGIDAVIFARGCSDPLFRRSIRVSMGNIFIIPWTVYKSENYMDILKGLGFKTVAMALRSNTINIEDKEIKKEDKLAIILGNEGDGLPEETLDKCDYIVKIPMREGVDSLNVAAASAIAFWELV